MPSNFTRRHSEYIVSQLYANTEVLGQVTNAEPVSGPAGEELTVRVFDPAHVNDVSQGSFGAGDIDNTFTTLTWNDWEITDDYSVSQFQSEEAALNQALDGRVFDEVIIPGFQARAEFHLIEALMDAAPSETTLGSANDPTLDELYSAIGDATEDVGGTPDPSNITVMLHPTSYWNTLSKVAQNVRNQSVANGSLTTLNNAAALLGVAGKYDNDSGTQTAASNSETWGSAATNVVGYVFHRKGIAQANTGAESEWLRMADSHWYANHTFGFAADVLDSGKVVELKNP